MLTELWLLETKLINFMLMWWKVWKEPKNYTRQRWWGLRKSSEMPVLRVAVVWWFETAKLFVSLSQTKTPNRWILTLKNLQRLLLFLRKYLSNRSSFFKLKHYWMFSDAFKVRHNLHAGMIYKPLESYHPLAYRSRLPSPTIVMPYKNSSQIVIGDRSSYYKKQFVTTAQNMYKRPKSIFTSN